MRTKLSTGRDPDEVCLRLAAQQHGVLTRRQALDAGISPSAIKHRLDTQRWTRLHRGIYFVAGLQPSAAARIHGACLAGGPGTAAARRTAAALHGLDGFTTRVIEIVSDRRLSLENIVCIRQTLLPREVKRIEGIPVTSIHRTLTDLGDVVPWGSLEDALDCALRLGLTSVARLEEELERSGTKGRRGAAALRRLLCVGYGPPPSWLERRFVRLLRAARLDDFVREHPALCFRIDFAWPHLMLGIEVHGAKWHMGKLPSDLARHNALTTAGWTILHYTWPQIRDEPDRVLHEVKTTVSRLSNTLF